MCKWVVVCRWCYSFSVVSSLSSALWARLGNISSLYCGNMLWSLYGSGGGHLCISNHGYFSTRSDHQLSLLWQLLTPGSQFTDAKIYWGCMILCEAPVFGLVLPGLTLAELVIQCCDADMISYLTYQRFSRLSA